jgi:N-acetylmuramoyl-L-alanine amidase
MTARVPFRAVVLAIAALASGVVVLDAAPRRVLARQGRPDAALYREAQTAEQRLKASGKRLAKRADWETVVVRYRKLIARYPRSGYCDNALLAIGDLYRQMARRFRTPRYREDALAAYRSLVSEYPSSSLGEDALFSGLEIARDSGDHRRLTETARAYLDTYPEGRRAAQVKRLMRQREPSVPLPSPPTPGLASVFDLRAWSGESSTRVVIDLARQVPIQSDRLRNPDRLWIDLIGTRLHPNLAQRVFPVGDGLLEKVRIAKNREDVIRVVLDFKEVWEHQVFYLENPTRLVIDVRGQSQTPRTAPAGAIASARPAPSDTPAATPSAASAPPPAASRAPRAVTESAGAQPPTTATTAAQPLPSRPLDTIASSPAQPAAAAPRPIVLTGAGQRPSPSASGEPSRAPAARAPAPQRAALPTPPPEPPATNRAGSYSLARQLGLGARRIVIDAGHGGHDPGTIGRGGLQEKDLVLDVALRLERLVRQELAAEVVLTRSTDVYVPLEERTAIANGQLASSHPADLFLSIHANASRNSTARGIETYFLNFARSRHAEAVAARENAISPATLKDLQGLVKAIATNSKIDESRDFAASVQEGMVRGARGTHSVLDRGVHTAPFYVLIGANMPAVLAEIAFLSNAEDEQRLRTAHYRDLLARSLLTGVRGYLEALNRTQLRQLTDGFRRSTVPARGGVRAR